MNHRFGIGLLGLALMLTLAFGAVACSSTSGNEPAKAVVTSVGGGNGADIDQLRPASSYLRRWPGWHSGKPFH